MINNLKKPEFGRFNVSFSPKRRINGNEILFNEINHEIFMKCHETLTVQKVIFAFHKHFILTFSKLLFFISISFSEKTMKCHETLKHFIKINLYDSESMFYWFFCKMKRQTRAYPLSQKWRLNYLGKIGKNLIPYQDA